MQLNHADSRERTDIDYLRRLDGLLRGAMQASLINGAPELAVALDTARGFLETVLEEPDPTSTRIALARVRAEIALESWRRRAGDMQ